MAGVCDFQTADSMSSTCRKFVKTLINFKVIKLVSHKAALKYEK